MTAADELLALVVSRSDLSFVPDRLLTSLQQNTILAKLPEGANRFIVFFGVLQGYLWRSIDFSQGKLVFDSALWRTLVWWAGWVSFFLAAWSLCVSHVLHLDSAGRPSRSFVAQAPFLNTFGLLTILASSTSIGILGGASHLKYRSAMSNYKQIDTALSALQITYNGRFDVSAFQSGTGFAIAEKFIQDLSSFGTYFRWTFISYLIWTILLEILLVGAGVLHLRELRRTMDELSNRTRVSPEARAQERMIEQTYNSLVYITYGVCILLTAVNAIFAFVSAAGTKVVYIRSYAEAAGLLPPWIFATLGLPLSLLFFRRTYLASKSKQSSPSTSAEDKVVSPVQPPTNHDVDLALTSVISTSQKPQVGAESYPMSTLAYAQDTPPISPTSPGSTVESSTGRLGGSRGPGSIDTSDSSSRLYGTDITTRNEAPFYSSYATRQPNDVEEIQTENIRGGTASRSSKGFNWR
ncbi:uncharacterized protein JCM6883_003557 [Sporobolomyces salmoneus]|uniref:uncharacterized protein n=1 Tax=Sporobolomyces salmoneus TaxID=183962 RepID=UPI003170EBFE